MRDAAKPRQLNMGNLCLEQPAHERVPELMQQDR
jgi:hypothetical protein